VREGGTKEERGKEIKDEIRRGKENCEPVRLRLSEKHMGR
jgi:hypothetical protein